MVGKETEEAEGGRGEGSVGGGKMHSRLDCPGSASTTVVLEGLKSETAEGLVSVSALAKGCSTQPIAPSERCGVGVSGGSHAPSDDKVIISISRCRRRKAVTIAAAAAASGKPTAVLPPPPRLKRDTESADLFVNLLIAFACKLITAMWPLSATPPTMMSNCFHGSAVIPLHTFIYETLRRSKTSYSTLQIALYYLILLKPSLSRLHFNPTDQPSLILASKYIQDRNYSTRAWSKISGLRIPEINENERQYLRFINYSLHIKQTTFENWTKVVLLLSRLLAYLAPFRLIKEKMTRLKKKKSTAIFSIAKEGSTAMQQKPSQDKDMSRSQSSSPPVAHRVNSTACITPLRASPPTSSQAWETQSTIEDEPFLRDTPSTGGRTVLQRRASTQMLVNDQWEGDDVHVPQSQHRSSQLVSSSVSPHTNMQDDADEHEDPTNHASTELMAHQRQQQEYARYLSKAPATVVKSKDKVSARSDDKEGMRSRETNTETVMTPDWADLPSELSDTSEAIRQLMMDLGDEAFFSISTKNNSNKKRTKRASVTNVWGADKKRSFHPQGAWGEVESLTDSTDSIISVDSSLLNAPLPRNTAELIHEVADRCDREFTRLRLNIRMMSKAEKKAEQKALQLENELEIAKKERQELLSRFAELVPQARLAAGLGTEERDFRLPSGLSGYEADLGDVGGVDGRKAKKHRKREV
ncbi:hypothetical protein DV738_g3837, partial [Chaetothyriales sp. CBS 135597]